jgi:AAA ATPase domain
MPMSLPDRARTLKEAFQVCDVGPLYGDSLRFYAELDTVRRLEAIQMLTTELEFLEPGQFGTILFTGHRGCGKSTELRKLEKNWNKDYRVIYLEVDNQIDINDADYTDLYLVLVKQISDDLARLKLNFDLQLLKEFQSWFLEITDETEETVEKSVSLETSLEVKAEVPLLSKLMAKLLAQIKGSHKQKRLIREVLQRNVGRLQEDINKLLEDAFSKVQEKGYPKGFLVIFDNLDRVSPAAGDKLYFDHPAQIKGLNCTIIYTVPISVVYSNKNLNNAFGQPNILPMVDIYNLQIDSRDLRYNAAAVQKFANVIEQRMDVDSIFDDRELISMLGAASGGHIRQLMQMTANACLISATRKHQRVMQDDVIYAVKREQFNFERVIPSIHYPMLVQVCKTKRVKQDEDGHGQTMLFNTSVLEYEGDRRWNYVNPVIRRSEAFLEALRDADD